MARTYSKTYSRIVIVLLALSSFLVYIYPGIEDNLLGKITSILIWMAVFAYLLFYIKGRYRVDLPAFMEQLDRRIDLDYILPRSIHDHYLEFIRKNLDLIALQDGIENVYYYLYDSMKGKFILQESISAEAIQLSSELPVNGNPIGDVFDAGEALILSNHDKLNRSFELIYKAGRMPNCIIGTPIEYEGQILGVLAADSYLYDAFRETDIQEILATNSRLLSTGLQYLEAIYQLDRKSIFLHKLANFNTYLSMVDKEEELFDHLVSLARDFFQYDMLTIAELDKEDRQKGVLRFIDGPGADELKDTQFEIGTGIWSYIITRRERVNIRKANTEYPVPCRLYEGDLKKNQYKSLLGVPLTVGENTLGVLILESKRPAAYTDKDADVLSLIGLNYASASYRLNLYHTMKQIATVDGLTGIANHRAFMERSEEELHRAKRYEYALIVMMMDLDKFKRINDTHGHLYGDYVLREVADIIKSSVRIVDIVGRYGGEEFTVVLTNAKSEGSIKTAERIRDRIAAHKFHYNNIDEHLTISIGLSRYPDDGSDLLGLIQTADEAMYESKKIGGNHVIFHSYRTGNPAEQ